MIRRKKINYSVKGRMQKRLFISVMFVVIISVGLMALSFYIFANQEAGESYKQFHVNVQNLLDLLLPAVIIATLVGLVTAFIVAMFLPLKWVGPVYRIEQELKTGFDKGSLDMNFSLRDGDEFCELAQSLEMTFCKVRSKVGDIKSATVELKNALSSDMHSTETEAAFKKIEDALGELKL
ncbi:hypothetical protein MNBD_DELTA01-289 [hydrothermal vent metagenome]|uniref:HAMP domain-containing protein n=1 Tax=hydrothermal vent metagenome TaxID=652676 RepID=A0A3B0R5K1_9ZZZZ